MPDAPVLFRRDGGTGWLTLNRPARMNALDEASVDRIIDLVGEAATDSSLRVLVLTGTGRAFCAGADLDEVAGEGQGAYLDRLHRAFAALREFPRPLVGALNGVTAAGGLELALCCDLIVAAASARIGDAHIAYGLVPGGGAATILPRRIGLHRAKEMLFTGSFVSATTLLDWGLLNWVVPDEELDAFAADLARRLAALSSDALQAMKALANASAAGSASATELLAREAATMRAHLASADALDGLSAFREKRPPIFA